MSIIQSRSGNLEQQSRQGWLICPTDPYMNLQGHHNRLRLRVVVVVGYQAHLVLRVAKEIKGHQETRGRLGRPENGKPSAPNLQMTMLVGVVVHPLLLLVKWKWRH